MAVTREPGSETNRRSLEQRRERSPLRRTDYELFSPFSLMSRISDEMDRFFGAGRGFGSGAGGGMMTWSPPMEVSMRGNDLVITADLPGMKREDVKVEVVEDQVVIEGERKREQEDREEGYYRSERSYGHFFRAVPLPQGAQCEQAKAQFRDGVLEVTVPCQAPQSNRRQIPIESSQAAATVKNTGEKIK